MIANKANSHDDIAAVIVYCSVDNTTGLGFSRIEADKWVQAHIQGLSNHKISLRNIYEGDMPTLMDALKWGIRQWRSSVASR